MDPIRNPYAPGAGQRPPELAGRDEQLHAFDVTLERVSRGRPERSVVLTGLRGVGKTVLLNALRSAAVRAHWGTGKLEARPDQPLRRPLSAALHMAVRELGHPQPDEVAQVLGVIKSFAQRESVGSGVGVGAGGRAAGGRGAGGGAGARGSAAAGRLRDRWSVGIDVPAVSGRADSGDIEIDLVEVLSDVGGLAADRGAGVAIFIDEMQDLGADDVSALCAAAHEISQSGLPVVIVGAGLPHLPAVLSASKSYSERLFRYSRIDRLDAEAAEIALRAPAAEEGASWSSDALGEMYAVTAGYPYFVQAYGKAVWDTAVGPEITVDDVRMAAPEAEAELAVGFFGSRYERATPAEREYLRAMADAAYRNSAASTLGVDGSAGDLDAAGGGSGAKGMAELDAVPTAEVAALLGKRPQSLSPARDSLMKKGLVYSSERGQIAFTVPHFGRYLRAHPE